MRHLFQFIWGFDFDGLTSKLYSLARFATFVVTVASGLANFLPKEDRLECFPRLQRFYGGFRKMVAGAALNLRHHMPNLGYGNADKDDQSHGKP